MINRYRISAAVVLAIFVVLTIEITAQRYQFTSDEIRVLRSLQTLHGAEATYQATTGNGNFGTLKQLGRAGLIDPALASGYQYGYAFDIVLISRTPTTGAEFYVTATPRRYRLRRYSFFLELSGLIRGAVKRGQPATVNDPVLVVDFCTSVSIAENERCIIQSLRNLHGAEATYAATYGNGDYGGLTELGRVSFIHSVLATGLIHGYSISVVVFRRTIGYRPAEFRIIALPQNYGETGIRSFYIGTDGILYGADRNGRPADENDPPIDQ